MDVNIGFLAKPVFGRWNRFQTDYRFYWPS